MCSAAALDDTSSTLPYIDDTEPCIEALHAPAPASRYEDDDRGLSINIGWDENVAIEINSDGEDEDINECGVLLSNNFIRYACAEDCEPAPYAQSDDDDVSVTLDEDNVIYGHGGGSEVETSGTHRTVEIERPHTTESGSTVRDVYIERER